MLETIRIENSQICHLAWHNARLNRSRQALLGTNDIIDLGDHIRIPEDLGTGTYRCRVLYGREIDEVQFHPHRARAVRSLRLIQSDDISYEHKYADRKKLEELFELRGECDDILIIKKGFITDTSVSNVIFSHPDGRWLTPSTPLLKGTMRTYLLDTGRIAEAFLGPEDLSELTGAKMINCMMDLDSSPVIEMKNIRC